jgi:DNA modification methylase
VALVADAIKDCSHRGGVVLDPFAGSGTTLIAAEKTGRIGCGMELDPHYVDVIVRRWESFTGATARHAASGHSFAETASARTEQADSVSLATDATEPQEVGRER